MFRVIVTDRWFYPPQYDQRLLRRPVEHRSATSDTLSAAGRNVRIPEYYSMALPCFGVMSRWKTVVDVRGSRVFRRFD